MFLSLLLTVILNIQLSANAQENKRVFIDFSRCKNTLSHFPETGYGALWDENSITRGNPVLGGYTSHREFSNYEMTVDATRINFSKKEKGENSTILLDREGPKVFTVYLYKTGKDDRLISLTLDYDLNGTCFVKTLFNRSPQKLVEINYDQCRLLQEDKVQQRQNEATFKNCNQFFTLAMDDEKKLSPGDVKFNKNFGIEKKSTATP